MTKAHEVIHYGTIQDRNQTHFGPISPTTKANSVIPPLKPSLFFKTVYSLAQNHPQTPPSILSQSPSLSSLSLNKPPWPSLTPRPY